MNIKPVYGIVHFLVSHSRIQDNDYPVHAHKDYSVSLVLGGEHSLITDDEKYEIEVGMVRVLHPGQMHSIERSTWEQINISIEAGFINAVAHELGREVPVVFETAILDNKLEKMIIEIGKADTADRIYDLVVYMIEAHSLQRGETDNDRLVSPELEKARNYIDQHAHESDLDIEILARVAHMSKYHFLRRFKQAYDRTPNQYLQNIRIDCVRKKLAEQMPLADVAVECGFYDQSHMIKTYKKYYGHTPAQAHPQKSNILL